MAKKTYFTLKEMVSFGRYLLSEKRESRIRNLNEETRINLPEERLREVYDADIANWKEENGNG